MPFNCLDCDRELKLTPRFDEDGKSTRTPIQIQDQYEEEYMPVNESVSISFMQHLVNMKYSISQNAMLYLIVVVIFVSISVLSQAKSFPSLPHH